MLIFLALQVVQLAHGTGTYAGKQSQVGSSLDGAFVADGDEADHARRALVRKENQWQPYYHASISKPPLVGDMHSIPRNSNPLMQVERYPGLPASMVMAKLPYRLQAALQNSGSVRILRKGSIQCPEDFSVAKRGIVRDSKYIQRNQDGQCDLPQGMWAETSASPVLRYMYETIAEVFNLQRGDHVLDWGAGCGHGADMIAHQRGVEVTAFDLEKQNVIWGRQHMKYISSFCVLDGCAPLPFDTGSFDAVLGNAALYHAPNSTTQCTAVKEVLRVLKRGGCAWFGYLGNDDAGYIVPPDFWTGPGGCLHGHSGVEAMTMKETELFNVTEYADEDDSKDSFSLIVCKPHLH